MEHDQVIEALSSKGSDEPLGVAVLPRRSRSDLRDVRMNRGYRVAEGVESRYCTFLNLLPDSCLR
jgi:hypothetical protein